MALLGLGVLMHLVLTGLRAGRHEVATLRALGFSTRQVRAAAAWQATIVTVVPFALGGVAGLVAGRLVWLSYADHLNVAPATVLAWRPIVGFLLLFLVVANVIGAVAAWRLSRQRPAVELRTE